MQIGNPKTSNTAKMVKSLGKLSSHFTMKAVLIVLQQHYANVFRLNKAGKKQKQASEKQKKQTKQQEIPIKIVIVLFKKA